MRTVTLTFILKEDVTPEIFARKIATACARGGALRKGERVSEEHTTHGFLFEYVGDILAESLLGPRFAPTLIPSIEQIHP